MKTIFLSTVIPLLLLVSSCGSNTENSNNQDNTTIDEVTTASTTDNLSKQEACSVFDNNKVASILGVDAAALKSDDMSFGEKRSICYYYTAEGNRKLYIRLAWASEKSAENKVLEKQYAKFLSEGAEAIQQYKEVNTSNGNQILYGVGQDREGKYVHIMRKRLENKAEIQLEIVKETEDATGEETLLKLVNSIQ